jgi:7-cyano-7-deazaguanine reductase
MTDNEDPSTPVRGLSQLGRISERPGAPDQAVLERVANPHAGLAYLVRFTCPEFTSICPVTGQPDFAHLVIDYVPGDWIVESKSLKLYLSAYRDHGAFHEACTVAVATDICRAIAPQWLRIGGYWYPRGGIPIDIFWQTGTPPEGLWLPDQGVAPYRGRG